MRKVLVVDDERLVRKGIISTFPWEKYGFSVSGEAANGEAALAFLSKNKVDLLVTDLTMPGMSGLELIKRVREQDDRLNVIILTCHDDFKYIQEAMRLEVLDYIVKTEIEDHAVEEMFARISQKMDGRKKSKAIKHANNDSGESVYVQQLADKWNDPEWIHADKAFEDLKAETKEKLESTHERKRLFYQTVLEWDRLLEIGAMQSLLEELDQFLKWADWEKWILSFRQAVQKRITNHTSRQTTAVILNAIKIINANEELDIRESEIAGKVNMSRSHFGKCFKKVTGKSYGEYMKIRKMEKAKLLIYRTDESITEIADLCGFSDYRHFSRVFREYTGMLPNEYRKASHNERRQE